MATKDIKYTINGDDAPFASMLRRVDTGLRSVDSRIESTFSKTSGTFGSIATLVGRLGGLLTTGAFAVGVRNAINLQDEMHKSAQRAGTSTENFSSMAYAASLADLEVQDLQKAYVKLNSTIVDGQQGQKEAVELFRRLRIDPKNIKDADQLLLALAERFETMPSKVQKTALAVDVFGEKLGPRLVPFLNQGRAGIEELRKEAERLGVVVSSETGRAAEEFNDTMTKIGKAAQGVALGLASELLPVLQAVADEMLRAKQGSALWDGLGKAVRVVGEAVVVFGANILYVIKTTVQEVSVWVQQLAALARLDFKGFAEIGEKWKQDAAAARKELDAFEARVMGRRDTGGEFTYVPDLKKSGDGTPDPKKPSATTAKDGPSSYMQYYELLLAEEKRARAILEDGREMSKQEELAFWRDLMDNLQMTTRDRVAVQRKAADLELDIARRTSKERAAIELEDLGASRELALSRVAAEEEAARHQVALGTMTAEQMQQLELEYEERRYQIRLAALQQRLELASRDPDLSPVERRRILNDILLLEAEHQRAVGEIRRAITTEAASPVLSVWNAAEEQARRSTEGMLNRTMSLKQGLTAIWASIRQAIVGELAKILVAKIAAFAKERILTLAGIGMNAARAGAGAAASQASIPYVGPILAIAAMGAMLAAVGGLSAMVPSAERGWIVPRGMNPLTQLHEEEMVLPRAESKAVQDMAGGGGGGGPIAVHIHTPDAEGMRRLLMNNAPALAAAIEHARRNFHLK